MSSGASLGSESMFRQRLLQVNTWTNPVCWFCVRSMSFIAATGACSSFQCNNICLCCWPWTLCLWLQPRLHLACAYRHDPPQKRWRLHWCHASRGTHSIICAPFFFGAIAMLTLYSSARPWQHRSHQVGWFGSLFQHCQRRGHDRQHFGRLPLRPSQIYILEIKICLYVFMFMPFMFLC